MRWDDEARGKTRAAAPSTPPAPRAAWAVQLIGDRLESSALSRYAQLQKKYQAILGGREPLLGCMTMGKAAIWHRIGIAAISATRQRHCARGCARWAAVASSRATERFTAAVALADRIAAPLGDWREASQAARKNRNVRATLRFQ